MILQLPCRLQCWKYELLSAVSALHLVSCEKNSRCFAENTVTTEHFRIQSRKNLILKIMLFLSSFFFIVGTDSVSPYLSLLLFTKIFSATLSVFDFDPLCPHFLNVQVNNLFLRLVLSDVY